MHATVPLFSLTFVIGIALSSALPGFAVPPVCGTIKVSSPDVNDKTKHSGCVFFGEPCGKSASDSANKAETAAEHTLNLYGDSVCYDIQGEMQSYQIADSSCQCEFFSFQGCNAQMSVPIIVTGDGSLVPLESAKSYFCQKF